MQTRYTATAILLHWLIGLALLCMLALGFYMQSLPLSPEKLKLFSWHKWAGVTIFLLVCFRLAWRLSHRPPALPASMPPWARLAAHAVHWLLYGLMLAIPLSGWLMSSAQGFQTVWFGVIPLPDLLPRDREMGKLLTQVHVFLNWTLIACISLHVLAVLKHQFLDRDDLLSRMLCRTDKEK